MWYHTLSLHYACIQRLGIIRIPEATCVPNFISVATSIAELDHGEKSSTQPLSQSPSLIDATGTKAFASENQTLMYIEMQLVFKYNKKMVLQPQREASKALTIPG